MIAFRKFEDFSSRMDAGTPPIARGFWRKLRDVAGQVPFAGDAVAAYYCALDRETPARVRAALLAALAYFILPADMVPDFLPGLGYTDDAAVLAAALQVVASHILPEHREAARRVLEGSETPHCQS